MSDQECRINGRKWWKIKGGVQDRNTLGTVEGRTCQGTGRKPSSKGHKPGTAGRVASEKTERKRWSKGHSPSGGHGGKATSGIEQKRQSRGCSPTGGCRGIWQDTERMQHSEGLTTRRLQREGRTMTQKESAHIN